MNWWDLIHEAGETFLLQHGVVAAFIYLALEEGGVPIPIPGDFLMLALGARAREGSIVLWQVIAAMEAGTVLGSSLLYLLALRGGRGVVERYGPFIGIGPAQLDRADGQLQRHGATAVVLGRLLPGLRILTAIACGIFRVPYRVFLPAMGLGSLISSSATRCSATSPDRGSRAVRSIASADRAGWLWWPAAAPAGGGVLVRRGLPHPLPRPELRTWRRFRVGLLAGLLASLGALWTLDLMVVVAGDLAWRLPDSPLAVAAEQLAQALTRDATGGLLWLVAPLSPVSRGVVCTRSGPNSGYRIRRCPWVALCVRAVPREWCVAGAAACAGDQPDAHCTRSVVRRSRPAGLLRTHLGTRLPRPQGTPLVEARA